MIGMDDVENAPRILLVAELTPALGDRFQPTGFADLGAAQYTRPDGKKMLLVESAQSVANRLEKTCLDGDGPDLAAELRACPYVVATLSGAGDAVRTSSLIEAHRIGSPYFLHNKDFKDKLAKEMKYNPKRPLDWKPIYATLVQVRPQQPASRRIPLTAGRRAGPCSARGDGLHRSGGREESDFGRREK